MEVIERFSEEEEHRNWLKGVFLLICAQKPLELFIDNEIGDFHQELLKECGDAPCSCDVAASEGPQTQQKPLCDECRRWKEKIKKHHNKPSNRIFWKNTTPQLWSTEKWEVAKAYMPGGHETHKLLGDFDIAALLGIMANCRHFEKFQIIKFDDLVKGVSEARNRIMHSSKYKLKKNELRDYAERIRNLGVELAEHNLVFKDLSEDTDTILKHDFTVALPDGKSEEDIQAHHEKELELLKQSLDNTINSLRHTQALSWEIMKKQSNEIQYLRAQARETNIIFWIVIVLLIYLCGLVFGISLWHLFHPVLGLIVRL